ncbi:MAG: SoxR reducing system RseC family protein [Methylococcaceae bacterium]
MIEEVAVVAKVENGQVWVQAAQNSGCGGCQQKTTCATSALSGIIKKKPVVASSAFELKAGDEVLVAVDESVLLGASFLLYFMPLLGLFLGGGLANWLLPDSVDIKDLWVAICALSTLFLALGLINRVQTKYLIGGANLMVVKVLKVSI